MSSITYIFIFAHQDDEFGIYEKINWCVKNKKNILIFYMTSGSIKKKINSSKIFYRDKESLKVLKKIGVDEKNIIFFGRLNNIETCFLYKKIKSVYKKISYIIKNIKGKKIIFTHAWEGGNEDHDACYLLTKKIFLEEKLVLSCYQFPLYNSYKKSILPYQVQKTIDTNGKTIKIYTSFKDRIKYISYLFYYKSQIRIWVGLYPFIIFNLLFKGYYYLQKINKERNFKKPHCGKLLYEKFKRCDYNTFRKKLINFI